jgi:hypothetical protein
LLFGSIWHAIFTHDGCRFGFRKISSKWSLASIVFATYVADWRPNDKLRPNGQCQLQVLRATQRRIDGSGSGGFHG